MKNIDFESLVNSEGKKIYNYLHKMLRNKEDAEDITQETFLACYEKWETIAASSRKNYLFKTAYHKALNLIRSKKKKDPILLENTELLKAKQPPEKNPNNALVRRALSKLNVEETTLIELQFYQKMSYKQIAKIMGTTASAVDSKLVRAKKKLRDFITKEKMQEKSEKFVL